MSKKKKKKRKRKKREKKEEKKKRKNLHDIPSKRFIDFILEGVKYRVLFVK